MNNLLPTIITAAVVAVLTVVVSRHVAAPPSSLELAHAAAAIAEANAAAEAACERCALHWGGESSNQLLSVRQRSEATDRREAFLRQAWAYNSAAQKYADEATKLYERATSEN